MPCHSLNPSDFFLSILSETLKLIVGLPFGIETVGRFLVPRKKTSKSGGHPRGWVWNQIRSKCFFFLIKERSYSHWVSSTNAADSSIGFKWIQLAAKFDQPIGSILCHCYARARGICLGSLPAASRKL